MDIWIGVGMGAVMDGDMYNPTHTRHPSPSHPIPLGGGATRRTSTGIVARCAIRPCGKERASTALHVAEELWSCAEELWRRLGTWPGAASFLLCPNLSPSGWSSSESLSSESLSMRRFPRATLNLPFDPPTGRPAPDPAAPSLRPPADSPLSPFPALPPALPAIRPAPRPDPPLGTPPTPP